MHDYNYDVFISYRRSKLILPWVTNFFLEFFELWLNEKLHEMGEARPARIFFDQVDNEPGVVWPQNLERALKTSKILLSICSPTYFSSRWCISEWQSFAKREEHLGITGLRIPVRHNDCERYLQDIEWSDFYGYTFLARDWYQSAHAAIFEKKVEELARVVARAILSAPPFEQDWPVISLAHPPVTDIQQHKI